MSSKLLIKIPSDDPILIKSRSSDLSVRSWPCCCYKRKNAIVRVGHIVKHVIFPLLKLVWAIYTGSGGVYDPVSHGNHREVDAGMYYK